MSDLSVCLSNQNATFVNNEAIYSGDIGTDTITFTFCEKWDGYIKTAVFYRSKDEVYQVMLDENNTCVIPAEVLTREGTICIGVYGVDGDKVLTSECLRYRVLNGAVSDQLNIEGPTLTVFEQVISQYGRLIVTQDDFIAEWKEKVEQDIVDARNATAMCLSAIDELKFVFVDMDGGTPTTEENLYENNYNGGYAVNND